MQRNFNRTTHSWSLCILFRAVIVLCVDTLIVLCSCVIFQIHCFRLDIVLPFIISFVFEFVGGKSWDPIMDIKNGQAVEKNEYPKASSEFWHGLRTHFAVACDSIFFPCSLSTIMMSVAVQTKLQSLWNGLSICPTNALANKYNEFARRASGMHYCRGKI